MELPPGFRFHPTDEELITHYLSKKVKDASFDATAIGEVDLNECEPWDLPWRAKMGEKEWYFFCVRDRKYPTGLRTNRATEAGYWKATGRDKEVCRGKNIIVGMKKTLVFYRGRAPKGEKTDWVMHEYRLEGKFSACYLSKPAKEWGICRVFKKSCGGKKTTIGGYEMEGISSALLPPLMDVASDSSARVTCFSIVAEEPPKGAEEQEEEELVAADYFSNTNFSATSLIRNYNNFQGGFGSFVQLLQNDGGYEMKQQSCYKTEKEMLSNVSQETGITTDLNPEISSLPSASTHCFWSY